MSQPQTLKVILWMKAHGTITPLQAKDELGIMRLAARINDIRHGRGVAPRPVYSRRIKVKTRDGVVTQVAQYSLDHNFPMRRDTSAARAVWR